MVVPATVNDRHQAVLVKPFEPHHRRVESETWSDVDGLLLRDRQVRPRAIVRGVAEGDDGVEAVIPTGQLDHDEYPVAVLLDAGPFERLRGQRGRGPAEDHRQRRADTDPVETPNEEFTARTGADTCHLAPLLRGRVPTPFSNPVDIPEC